MTALERIAIKAFNIIRPILTDKLFVCLQYRLYVGKSLRLKNPQTFNEKLNWLKLYDRDPLYSTLVDKYSVKQWVADKIGSQYIIPTLGVWEKPEDIEWDALPEKFVLKTTHGGGGDGIVICKDKSKLNKDAVIAKLKRSMNTDPYKRVREWPYKNVKRQIIAEKYIEQENGELNDFKFFCFDGNVKFFKIDYGRFVKHRANYYNTNCEILPFGEVNYPSGNKDDVDIPSNLGQMILIAERISSNMPFVRVDLYNIKGHIFFGELTFYPAGGLGKYFPETCDSELGVLLTLPNKTINR